MLSKNVIVLPEFATSTRVFREVIDETVLLSTQNTCP